MLTGSLDIKTTKFMPKLILLSRPFIIKTPQSDMQKKKLLTLVKGTRG
jgi:hypothetical protein